ncbi:MAG TPA: ABC transporter ATP-binding protein [Acidimicrobiales bacterium]|nr:ABC transporter ATP-binding protein [Acidimicrobiales bacterium]
MRNGSADDLQMVCARGISKRFGDQQPLRGVDLDISRGSILGVIGPSGCGKTTLVRVLTGILGRDGGELSVLGTDPQHFTPRHRRRFGYMPQMPILFPNLSLIANLNFVASVYGMPLRRRKRLRDVLQFVDLWDHRHKRLCEASGGMQRRLVLAATLVHGPELLFLDEPTAGIDPILRDRFWGRFRDLRDAGRTLLVTTQYVGEAASCDLVAVMSEGRLLLVDSPDGLRRRAYGGDLLVIRPEAGWLSHQQLAQVSAMPFVRRITRRADDLMIVVDDGAADTAKLLAHFSSVGIPLQGVEPVVPSFDDVFVELIEADRARRPAAEAA